MTEPDDPVMIVVGGGAIALSTAQELCALQGHRVVVLWRRDPDFTRAVEGIGAVHIAAPRPDSAEALDRAGVHHAVTILALSPDDQLNLHAALLARDANPRIRIVLRQFNRTLAHKIEQNLPNCSVLSLAWHSAATYAAASVDPSCFRGLQFPEPDGPLTGFATRIAESCGVGGETVAGAERVLGARILAVDGKTAPARDMVLAGRAELVLYGDVAGLQSSTPRQPAARGHLALGRRLRSLLHRGRRQPPRLNPILVRLALAAFMVLLLGTWYFHAAFKGAWLDAVYFVVATMTTTGYGDLTPDRSHPVDIVSAMVLMLAGTIITGLFIAFGASLLTRVHWVSMQGLRPVHRRGHIVVCGAGSIGSQVIDLLLTLGKHLVVVEISPDTAMIERAREQRFDLLTGDASRDATLDLCNLNAAHGLIALTNVDTLNLEIALGARARNPTMPIVLRIAEASFAASIARHFEFETTYSAAALAAPAFVGLSRFPGSRGRVAFADQEFAVGEVVIAEAGRLTAPRDAILLAVSRLGDFAIADDVAELGPGDRALVIVPLAPFREGRSTLAAAAERFLPGG
ncbi:MAG: NAD-binding protein [Alphaproteobacteria bacterium]|nr:NAD-binding protein [Alphaproteobacteria bacterium]